MDSECSSDEKKEQVHQLGAGELKHAFKRPSGLIFTNTLGLNHRSEQTQSNLTKKKVNANNNSEPRKHD